MVESVKLNNFLSFGSNSQEIELRPLNIIVGTNGCGKSNFLEAFDLLRNAPGDIKKPIRNGGGVLEWLYKGCELNEMPTASMEFFFNNFQYHLSFTSMNAKFEIVHEWLKDSSNPVDVKTDGLYYETSNGVSIFTDKSNATPLRREALSNISMISQAGYTMIPITITLFAEIIGKIKLYRDWSFGRDVPCRQHQPVDMPCEFLESDCSNLALVLNQMNHDIPAKRRLLKELQNFYPDVEDYFVNAIGNYVQIYFQERGFDKPIPASRLSDGTLRYLCLLAILCNPNPPPLICIEEPELGLHPDVIPCLARLMEEASEKCQLIVTTHSDILVDSFNENPEVILVAEKVDGETQMSRLKKDELAPWLEKYRLGALWTRGDIGGTRW